VVHFSITDPGAVLGCARQPSSSSLSASSQRLLTEQIRWIFEELIRERLPLSFVVAEAHHAERPARAGDGLAITLFVDQPVQAHRRSVPRAKKVNGPLHDLALLLELADLPPQLA
jgi:hypothetical protein